MFTHLKLCVAVVRHNFKWVEILIIRFSRVRVPVMMCEPGV